MGTLVVFYILLKEVPLFRSDPLTSHFFFLLIGLYCLSGTVTHESIVVVMAHVLLALYGLVN
jgi:hypothetical protein